MESKKEIKYDSPDAATFKTGIEGWVSADGIFFGKSEHNARYHGCTHVKCSDCDNYVSKGWTRCEACRNKTSVERYNALPFKEWDGKTPICTWDGDKYFFSEEELIEYLEENELQESGLMLVFCLSIEYPQLDTEFFGNDAHEDWEPEKVLVEAIRKLNEVVSTLPPHSYTVGKIRTSYDYAPETKQN